ncbi:MAG: zinc-ribbon domain-containing protein, partial [Planctomycetota bacterium]
MASTCQKCGKANEGGARYCSTCGYDMSTGLT